jgi:uncharacterized protein (UPF0210 family)
MTIALICFASAALAKGLPPLLPANRVSLLMPSFTGEAEAMTVITAMTGVIRSSVRRTKTVTAATLNEAIKRTGTLTGREIAR